MQSRKVHHVAPRFYPDLGGLETQILRLGCYLVKRGHEVVVHTSMRSSSGAALPETEEVDGIQIRRYRTTLRLGYYTSIFRPEIEDADVVHLHGYGFTTNDRVARRLRDRLPIVYSLHHGVAQPAPTTAARLKWRVYHSLVGMRTLQDAAAIIAASKVDRLWLERRGVAVGRVHVLPTGLEEDAYSPGSPERARERLRLGQYVLYLGRLHPEKSVHHLLRAVASLERPDISLVLAGPDNGARASLERLGANLGLMKRLVITGYVDEAMKRDLLAGCECLVLPSFYEAQGIAVAEAWAQGRPVVASRVGGIPFLVADEQDGLLYEWGDIAGLADRLRQLLEDPTTASAMGERGRLKALDQFAWKEIAPRFEEVYEAVLLR